LELQGLADSLEADLLVVATGRAGFRLEEMGRRSYLDRLCMFGGIFDVKIPSDSGLLVESTQNGWWYSLPTTSGLMFAGWMTDARALEGASWRGEMYAALSATRFTRRRLSSLRSVVSSAASSSYSARCSGRTWFAIGDATLARDPLSGEGVASALRSGWDAGGRILERFDGNVSDNSNHESAVSEYAAACSQMYGREKRWREAPFWKLRHSSLADPLSKTTACPAPKSSESPVS
jgi:2-polyprenyl-6-methoxyphenol hydroxylase-like FAD-dependent oxidoreductase